MPLTTFWSLRKPAGTDGVDVVRDVDNLADDVDSKMAGIVASFNTTPSLLNVTTETNVINTSFTPPYAGDYLFVAKVPFDWSAGVPTDAKAILYVGGNVIDFDVRSGPGGIFITYLRCIQSADLTATSTAVRLTVNRANGTGTINSRSVNARVDVYRAGLSGILL